MPELAAAKKELAGRRRIEALRLAWDLQRMSETNPDPAITSTCINLAQSLVDQAGTEEQVEHAMPIDESRYHVI